MQRPLGWYVRRIRSMRARELVHRVHELGAVLRMQYRYRRGRADRFRLPDHRNVAFCSDRADRRLPEFPWQVPGAAEQRAILAGEWPALGYAWQWTGDDSAWRRAPDTGRLWPQEFFGRIPYLTGNPYGDVRVAWEPSRLQQLVALALIARDVADESQAERAVGQIEEQFLSWVRANPHLGGIHYISVMECAQRIIALCIALDMVRDRLTQPERIWPALLRLVKGHADLIAARMSLHSSTGNHTVTEAAGLIFAGTLFPELDGATQWRDEGCRILEREAAQILPDGGGAEQAFRYLLLVVDLYGLVAGLLESREGSAPPAIRDAFERGRRFLGVFAAGYDDLPATGDSDSGFAVSRFLQLSWQVQNHAPGSRTFDEAGYTLLRAPIAGTQLRAIFDHGPFGLAPLFGHGHADALALTLRVADTDVLLDPGTYSYTGHPEWRSYFRSTAAHNTVTVDGEDQARQELSFMWSQAHAAELVARDGDGSSQLRVVGRHTGYSRLGVLHVRGVAYRSPGLIVIVDRLTGDGRHTLALNWHCCARPDVLDATARLTVEGTSVSLSIEGGALTLHEREESPKSGWRAPVYGVLDPATTLRASADGPLPARFVTVIRIGEEGEANEAVAEEIARLDELCTEAAAGAGTA